MTKNSGEKPKKEKEEVDLSQVSPDDIARRFLETPPKPKKKSKNESK